MRENLTWFERQTKEVEEAGKEDEMRGKEAVKGM
jgi:hypothetical protein